eukprot:2750376-Prorocentrum_lima.AAC.1
MQLLVSSTEFQDDSSCDSQIRSCSVPNNSTGENPVPFRDNALCPPRWLVSKSTPFDARFSGDPLVLE